jgi:transposase
MASITSPDFPGERLIVCRNPELAAERTRKREDLLAATEKDLAGIKAAVVRKRNPLCGTAEIALKLGAVLNTYKMKNISIWRSPTPPSTSPARPPRSPPSMPLRRRGAARDGIYVVRTSLAEATLGDADTVRSYKSLSLVERGFRCIKHAPGHLTRGTVDLQVRPVHHWLENRVRAHVFLCMMAYYTPLRSGPENPWAR